MHLRQIIYNYMCVKENFNSSFYYISFRFCFIAYSTAHIYNVMYYLCSVSLLQYYLHREKMRQVRHEENLEKINRVALRLAKEVADKTGTLFAGSICNTNIYKPNDDAIKQEVRAMFDEQVRWAKEEGAEFIIGETYHWLEEAEIALEVIKSYDLPAIINFGVLLPVDGSEFNLLDSIPVGEACKRLLDKGAYLVGSNCTRGPEQMVEVIEHIVKFCPPEKVCALPLGYRTTKEYPTIHSLRDDKCPDNFKAISSWIRSIWCLSC